MKMINFIVVLQQETLQENFETQTFVTPVSRERIEVINDIRRDLADLDDFWYLYDKFFYII